MVANLTFGKKGYEKAFKEMKRTAIRAQLLKDDFLRLVDQDTAAFNKLMDALRLPKATEDQIKERDSAVEEATKEATLVPFQVLEKSLELLNLAQRTAQKGNRSALSDAGVAALAARTAAEGAYYNVRINLPGIHDEEFKVKTRRRSMALKKKACRLSESIHKFIEREFAKL
jgi:glutamate formiminotransferase/formiminotetrahydrofolate cyclodeaminase